MKKISLLIFILYSSISFSKVCILNFERPNHYNTIVINEVFKNNPNTKVIHLAKPIDILTCVKEGFNEIIIAAHGAYNPDTPEKKAKLVYYREVRESELEKRKQDALDLASEYDETKRRTFRKKGGQRKIIKNEEYKRWEVVTGFLEDLENGRDFYTIDQFHPIIFKRILKELQAQDIKGRPKLKKIRMASCLEDSLKLRYQELNDIEEKYGVEIDWHPENEFGTFVKGIQSSQLTRSWLEESLR